MSEDYTDYGDDGTSNLGTDASEGVTELDTQEYESDWGQEEWHNAKYDSVESQAMAYNDLQSRFGGFEGSPESYEFDFADGVELDLDNERLQSLFEYGQQVGMDNDTMAGVLNFYVDELQNSAPSFDGEMEALGENADARIQAINNWIDTTDTDGSLREFVEANTNTAKEVEAVEHFMRMMGTEPSVTRNDEADFGNSDSRADIEEAMNDPRYQIPGEIGDHYRATVAQRWERLLG